MTDITTEAARVAFAERECREQLEEIDRKIDARLKVLAERAGTREQLAAAAKADEEMRDLVLARWFALRWREMVIEDGDIAMINDDGELRWRSADLVRRGD